MNRKTTEYCLLGIILNYPDRAEKLRKTGNIFQSTICYKIAEIILLTEKYNSQTIRETCTSCGINETEFENVYNSLFEIEQYNIYFEYVYSFYLETQLRVKVSEYFHAKKRNILDVKKGLYEIINTIDGAETNRNITSKEIVKKFLDTQNEAPKKIKSFVPLIDDNGGLESTDYVILAARPSLGKTTLILNLIRQQIKAGMKVGFFSLEVKPRKIIQILTCMEAEINEWRVKNNMLSQEEGIKIINSMNVFYNEQLIFGNCFDIEDIKSSSFEMKRAGCEVIYLDYLSYVISRAGKSTYEKVSYISKMLKLLAYELEIPVITLAQLNRSSETGDRKPKPSDLRDSGTIEQDADIIMLLSKQSDISKNKIVLDTEIAKYRNGATGSMKAFFDKSLRSIIFDKGLM